MANVRFNTPYGNYDPKTIFSADEATKTLRPISSAEAYLGAGNQFGQETVADPAAFQGYSVGAPITRADELAAVKNDLNKFQSDTFNAAPETVAMRQSSVIDKQITDAQAQYDAELKTFNEQRQKYNALDNVDLFGEFQKLRESQGVPALEKSYLDTSAARNNLPYTERAGSGNAGVMTENQLGANIQQKDIPLGIQESNLLERMKLANDYITTAVNLKATDADKSRAALEKAIALTQDATSAIQNRINNLSTLRSKIQADINTGMDNKRATINTLITTNALQKLPDAELRTLEAEAGFPVGSLSGIKKSMSPKADVITTATDDAGNVSIVTRDPETGVFSTHTIPGIGNKQTGKTAGETAQDKENQSAVAVYASTLQQAIDEGASPGEAMLAAVGVASSVGTTLDINNQNALLKKAQELFDQKASKSKPVAGPPKPTPQAQGVKFNVGQAAKTVYNKVSSAISNFLFKVKTQ